MSNEIKTVVFDPLCLDNQLCFALYVCSKEIIKSYKPLLEPLKLTYTGYITMLVLWENDDITVKELGRRLTLDSGTLTPLLKKLEALNYVKRLRSSTDERNVRIMLTDAGRKLRKKAESIPKEMLCSSGIDVNNAKKLLSLLHEFMKQLCEKEQ